MARWCAGPASPQCGLSEKVLNPFILQREKIFFYVLNHYCRYLKIDMSLCLILCTHRYLPPQSVQHCDISIHVEDVVGVRRVVFRGPLFRIWSLHLELMVL